MGMVRLTYFRFLSLPFFLDFSLSQGRELGRGGQGFSSLGFDVREMGFRLCGMLMVPNQNMLAYLITYSSLFMGYQSN